MPEASDDVVPKYVEPSFSETKDWLFKGSLVLGVLVCIGVIIEGALLVPWILIRWGWTPTP